MTVVLSLTDAEDGPMVIRRGGSFVLVDGDPEMSSTSLHAHEIARILLDHDRLLVAGRAPEGASCAEVTVGLDAGIEAVLGVGVWMAVCETSDAFQPIGVRFRDRSGTPVLTSWPRTWTKRLVADAVDACPGCGTIDWLAVQPRPARRPPRYAMCRGCGHVEALGRWISLRGRRWRRRRREPQDSGETVLDRAAFTVYAPVGLAVTLCGWSGLAAISEVKLGNEDQERGVRLTVETSEHDDVIDETAFVRQVLATTIGDVQPWPSASPEACSLWINAREREATHAAGAAQIETHPFAVDGVPHPFMVATAGDHWSATGRVGESRLTLSAQRVPLETVRLGRHDG